MIRPFVPADAATAARVVEIQRAAYRLEARLMGFDAIPPLHETSRAVQQAHLQWLGSYEGDRLVGVIAWRVEVGLLVIDRLAVDPGHARQGRGRALVDALPAADRTVVSTGSANLPARSLYEHLGFVPSGEREVAPGITVTEYERLSGPPRSALA